jgi:hypothetical protein
MWGALAIACGLVVGGCLPDPLPVEGIPVVKPQIVVSTQIIPDQSLVVLLTKTFGALDASDDSDPEALIRQIAVEDAVVRITGAGRTDTLLALGSGAYGGIMIPFAAGTSYRLDVTSESLGSVTATTTVQEPITFDDIDVQLYFNGFDDTLLQVTHQFKDPIGKDWYMVNVQQIEQEDLLENLLNPRAFTRLLDDVDFDGQLYKETFRQAFRRYHTGDTTLVFLSRISEEYYNFIQLRLDNRFSFVEYLGEPVNYPSNVTGGKGFFNLYVPDVRVFQVE